MSHPSDGIAELPQSSLKWGTLLIVSILVSGCAKVSIDELGLVSKPNMQFEEFQTHGLNSALLPQVEPGNNASGGAQSAGCIACK